MKTLALLLLMPVTPLQAEDSPVMVGSRVRFSAPTLIDGRVAGKVVAQDGEALTVEVDDRMPLRVPRGAIATLDVSTARKRAWRKGLLVGAALGAVAVAASANGDPDCNLHRDLCVTPLSGAGFGAMLGAAYGAGIGALFKEDRWNRVSTERVRMSLQPTPGRGIRAALSVTF